MLVGSVTFDVATSRKADEGRFGVEQKLCEVGSQSILPIIKGRRE